jgi:hypothetical protein
MTHAGRACVWRYGECRRILATSLPYSTSVFTPTAYCRASGTLLDEGDDVRDYIRADRTSVGCQRRMGRQRLIPC